MHASITGLSLTLGGIMLPQGFSFRSSFLLSQRENLRFNFPLQKNKEGKRQQTEAWNCPVCMRGWILVRTNFVVIPHRTTIRAGAVEWCIFCPKVLPFGPHYCLTHFLPVFLRSCQAHFSTMPYLLPTCTSCTFPYLICLLRALSLCICLMCRGCRLPLPSQCWTLSTGLLFSLLPSFQHLENVT